MEHPNAAMMRRGYEAFSRGDMDTLAEIMHEDVVWHISGRNAFSGDYKGRDEVFALFARLFQMTGGTLRVDLHAVTADDDHAVGLHTDHATRDGKSGAFDVALVAHVKDGKAVEFWEMPRDQYAYDEFWG